MVEAALAVVSEHSRYNPLSYELAFSLIDVENLTHDLSKASSTSMLVDDHRRWAKLHVAHVPSALEAFDTHSSLDLRSLMASEQFSDALESLAAIKECY
jgi:hypothetical protein